MVEGRGEGADWHGVAPSKGERVRVQGGDAAGVEQLYTMA